jgi:predicted transposase YbfD/YdcC
MSSLATASILSHFSSIEDPRVNRQKLHKLEDIFFITICAVICGADNWVAIEEFGKAKEFWFTEILGLTHGIPSHDTFGKVFSALDSAAFSESFSRWVSDLAKLSEGEIVAIDGKRVRRSMDTASNKAAIHMVSAWAHQNRLVLGQEKVKDKSNEITAIPKLLERLDIAGSIVTIDAMGCQREIAKKIVEKHADYVFSLKGNQGELYDDVKCWFENNTSLETSHTDIDAGHGRIETRYVRASMDIEWLKQRHHWPHIESIIAVTATRNIKEKEAIETRYFISSLKTNDAKRLGLAIRAHWAIENELHWTLDVAFDEDQSRARLGNSAANMATLRHIALNLAKSEKTTKVGVKTKRLKAGWDNNYMLKMLGII